MDLNSYIFNLKMQVRDYELDYQGIVNNANYLHYLEHTRHQFCAERGLTFAQMHQSGLDPVLRGINVEYLTALRADDIFFSCLNIKKEGPRFIFVQDIYRADGTPVIRAQVTVVCLLNGRLSRGEELARAFDLDG